MKSFFENRILFKLLVASTAIVSLFAFLGPYEYRFQSFTGLFFYYFSIMLFAIPLVFCGRKNKELVKKRATKTKKRLTLNGERMMLIILFISIISSAVFFEECIRVFSVDVLFEEGDYRESFSDIRTTLSKYAEMFSYLGPAGFLIVSNGGSTKLRILKPVSYIAILACGLTGLLLGARWKIFLCVLIILFAVVNRGLFSSNKTKQWIKRLLLIFFLIVLLERFMVLFDVRGLSTANDIFRFSPGDMALTAIASDFYQITNGAINPIYKAIDYIAQAPFVFSVIFEDCFPSDLSYGAYMFRPLGYILGFLGFDVPLSDDIANSTFTGAYSGTLYYLIVDYGLFWALVIFFGVGLLFAYIERRKEISSFLGSLFPLVCSVVLCSPIYYMFNVGGADYIFYAFVIIWIFLSFVGGFRNFEEKKL